MNDGALEPLSRVSWADPTSIVSLLPDALRIIADSRPTLSEYVLDSERVEKYPNFYKVVLREFATGVSMRLHFFPSPAVGSRHSHRWVFGSHVIAGRLIHNIYEEDTVYERREEGEEPLVMTRSEIPGGSYVLWPSNVHSIEVVEPSLTLVLRGPAVREQRFVHVPGVERGWSRRYNRPDLIPAGVDASPNERATIVKSVLEILRGSDPQMRKELGRPE